MSEHYIKKCSKCEVVISQCRCPGPKVEKLGVCASCYNKRPVKQTMEIRDCETKSLDQRVFEKMGFYITKGKSAEYYYWVDAVGYEPDFDAQTICETKERTIDMLPPISSQWETTAKYLVPFMREDGFNYEVTAHPRKLGNYFNWYGQFEGHPIMRDFPLEIINHDIAEAACKSFMEVSLD